LMSSLIWQTPWYLWTLFVYALLYCDVFLGLFVSET
jgi:hypothetical protein